MNSYITGTAIKMKREAKGLTQSELADIIGVTSKAVSKWETGKGFPDISLLSPLASALSVSVIELLNGETIINKNRASNMLKAKFYVCPICNNVIYSIGDALISCCGITLPPLEAEEADSEHKIDIEKVENEHFFYMNHEMTKSHYISFMAYVTYDKVEFIKLYPEGNAQTRFQIRGRGFIYAYCNKHGLIKIKI